MRQEGRKRQAGVFKTFCFIVLIVYGQQRVACGMNARASLRQPSTKAAHSPPVVPLRAPRCRSAVYGLVFERHRSPLRARRTARRPAAVPSVVTPGLQRVWRTGHATVGYSTCAEPQRNERATKKAGAGFAPAPRRVFHCAKLGTTTQHAIPQVLPPQPAGSCRCRNNATPG